MNGNVRPRVGVTTSSSPNVNIRVIHISPSLPLISAGHDPHLPCSSGVPRGWSVFCVLYSRKMISNTISLTSTVKSWSARPSSSPRYTGNPMPRRLFNTSDLTFRPALHRCKTSPIPRISKGSSKLGRMGTWVSWVMVTCAPSALPLMFCVARQTNRVLHHAGSPYWDGCRGF